MKKIKQISKKDLKRIEGGYSIKEFGADCKRLLCIIQEGMSIGSRMSPSTGIMYPYF